MVSGKEFCRVATSGLVATTCNTGFSSSALTHRRIVKAHLGSCSLPWQCDGFGLGKDPSADCQGNSDLVDLLGGLRGDEQGRATRST